MKEQKIQRIKFHRKKLQWSIIAIGIFALLLFFMLYFRIQKVSISGLNYYKEEDVEKEVISNFLEKNTVYLYLKYKLGKGISLPFIDEIEVEWSSHNTVQIHVYEKTIVACIRYMGKYLYFDKDGVIVESTEEKVNDIPLVSGVNFKKMTLYETLEVEDADIFRVILDISQLLYRYEIKLDQITFNRKKEVTFYKGQIKVKLGKRDTYDDPIAALSTLLPKALEENVKGTFNMENFQAGQESIIFKKDIKGKK